MGVICSASCWVSMETALKAQSGGWEHYWGCRGLLTRTMMPLVRATTVMIEMNELRAQ